MYIPYILSIQLYMFMTWPICADLYTERCRDEIFLQTNPEVRPGSNILIAATYVISCFDGLK